MRGLFGLVFALLFSGCALVANGPTGPLQPEEADLQVVEEANDGKWLYVLAKVRLPVPLTAEDRVVIEATGLKGPDVVASERRAIKPGDRVKDSDAAEYLAPFRLPAAGLTDYQLQLAWGEDAVPVASGEDIIKGLSLDGFEGESKDGYLTGNIANSGVTTVSKVVLLIEYGPLDSVTGVPQNAELVDLVGLQLRPGASRKITLQIPGANPRVSISDAD